MKAISISKDGVKTPAVQVVQGNRGTYYAIMHGEKGRGRWQVQIPLGVRDFPFEEGKAPDLSKTELSLVDIKKTDAFGNQLYLLGKGTLNGEFLVFWRLSPGYRGGASYEIAGGAKVISVGKEAQGIAGAMGGALCPVVHVEGPCILSWKRRGRLYGSAADWVAEFDGERWRVSEVEECALEDAALNY